jgi:hypothetical protein
MPAGLTNYASRYQREDRRMDARSGAILDVDNACAHFAAVDELEHCGQKDGALESRADEGSLKAQ